MSHERKPEPKVDPVQADQGGRIMECDPGDLTHADTEEIVRRKAYERYEQRGRTDGQAQEDWFVAERQVRSKAS